MPKDFRATALERAVGRKLAGWRDERQLSLTEAGQRVGFSSAKLSMMENAIQPSAPIDVMALGYVYQVPSPEWQEVWDQANRAATLRLGGPAETGTFDPAEDFPLLLAEATLLRTFTIDTVPNVLQLVDYTAALTQTEDPMKVAQLARVREVWLERSSSKDPLSVDVVFPEAVLRRAIGRGRAMKTQLLYLMEMSERPEVSIRVIPQSAGAYPAMGCPFTWLSFPHRQHNDVVYTETFLRCDYVEDQSQVEQVADRFSTLQQLVLGEGESSELIAEAVASL